MVDRKMTLFILFLVQKQYHTSGYTIEHFYFCSGFRFLILEHEFEIGTKFSKDTKK